ncbi:hypothetical protein [Polaribacter cellanae]|uniref:Uncharacterized protein n=1 Tax=Polaribacter cellanae TaxID=2818493 RepID=A0A975CM63_9FLAO|nr:hypothetical protein [Polaribacter cellanae]QTE21080.1 hypothetical protein J3359_09480 [Polaribacter cellanae]
MRTFLSIIILGIFLTGCEESIPPQQAHISILIDRTEVDGHKPHSDELIQQIKPQSPESGVTITLQSISDITYNPKQTFVLPEATLGWMGNEDQRRKNIKKFYKQFGDSIEASNQKVTSFNRSEIYRSLVEELNRLSPISGTKKVLLFSDLKEHSFFSVYNKQHLRLLEKSPEQVARLFIKQATPATDLKGIELAILYQPTLEDARFFSQLLSVYKSILEPKGVKIIVGFHHKIGL